MSREVRNALEVDRPVVALESTIISHGMPYPENIETAKRAQAALADMGVVGAVVAVIKGRICVGIDAKEIEFLATATNVDKISRRDLSWAVANRRDGATTVSATMFAAHAVGVRVFATGGIGGVHRGASSSFDVSADLLEFSRTPIIVVSAGAKAILDVQATLEVLETHGVPVVGYRTDDFPGFYSRNSGAPLPLRIDTASEAAELYRVQMRLGLNQGILIANPIPREHEIPRAEMDGHIERALGDADKARIKGKEVTPFLLERLAEITGGQSLKANIQLFESNTILAGEIARAL